MAGAHPDIAALIAFALGEIDDDERLSSHVGACQSCARTVADVRAGREWAGAARPGDAAHCADLDEDRLVERAVGLSSDEEAARIDELLAACDICRGRYVRLSEEYASDQAALDVATHGNGTQDQDRPMQSAAPRTGWWVTALAATALVGAGLAAYVYHRAPPADPVRGADARQLTLDITRFEGGQPGAAVTDLLPGFEGTRCQPGDVVVLDVGGDASGKEVSLWVRGPDGRLEALDLVSARTLADQMRGDRADVGRVAYGYRLLGPPGRYEFIGVRGTPPERAREGWVERALRSELVDATARRAWCRLEAGSPPPR